MLKLLDIENSVAFSIRCEGGSAGSLRISTPKASIIVAQRIVRDGIAQMWESVLVLTDAREDRLITRLMVCHPDWDQPLEIAFLESSGEELKVRLGETAMRQPP